MYPHVFPSKIFAQVVAVSLLVILAEFPNGILYFFSGSAGYSDFITDNFCMS